MAVPYERGHRDTTRKLRGHVSQPTRLLECTRADYDAVGPRLEKTIDLAASVDIAANLDRGIDAVQQGYDERRIVTPSCRGIQIGDVKTLESHRGPRPRDLDCVRELDGLAVAEVEGWYDDQQDS